jgi:hypothetical protein
MGCGATIVPKCPVLWMSADVQSNIPSLDVNSMILSDLPVTIVSKVPVPHLFHAIRLYFTVVLLRNFIVSVRSSENSCLNFYHKNCS